MQRLVALPIPAKTLIKIKRCPWWWWWRVEQSGNMLCIINHRQGLKRGQTELHRFPTPHTQPDSIGLSTNKIVLNFNQTQVNVVQKSVEILTMYCQRSCFTVSNTKHQSQISTFLEPKPMVILRSCLWSYHSQDCKYFRTVKLSVSCVVHFLPGQQQCLTHYFRNVQCCFVQK